MLTQITVKIPYDLDTKMEKLIKEHNSNPNNVINKTTKQELVIVALSTMDIESYLKSKAKNK